MFCIGLACFPHFSRGSFFSKVSPPEPGPQVLGPLSVCLSVSPSLFILLSSLNRHLYSGEPQFPPAQVCHLPAVRRTNDRVSMTMRNRCPSLGDKVPPTPCAWPGACISCTAQSSLASGSFLRLGVPLYKPQSNTPLWKPPVPPPAPLSSLLATGTTLNLRLQKLLDHPQFLSLPTV